MNRSPTFWLFLGVLSTAVAVFFLLEKRSTLACLLFACYAAGCYITSLVFYLKNKPPK